MERKWYLLKQTIIVKFKEERKETSIELLSKKGVKVVHSYFVCCWKTTSEKFILIVFFIFIISLVI